jgi:hypothetical protein
VKAPVFIAQERNLASGCGPVKFAPIAAIEAWNSVDSLVTMALSRGKAFLRSASKLNNILLVPCLMLNLDDAGTIFYTAALEVAKKIRREPVTAPGLSPI